MKWFYSRINVDIDLNYLRLLLTEYKGSHSSSRPHNLGVIVCMLVKCADKFLTLYDSDKQNRRKLQNIINLSSDELKEVRFSWS